MKSKVKMKNWIFPKSEVFYRHVSLLININAVLYAVVGGALMLSATFGVFNFMAGWPLLSIFLFFFLLWALVYEAYGAAALFLLKRFFEGFRCRLRPPVVCILYKPEKPPEVPVWGVCVSGSLLHGGVYHRREKLATRTTTRKRRPSWRGDTLC